MRFLAFILSIMVLVLSVMPCADAHEVVEAGAHGWSFVTAQESDCGHDSNYVDLCSPFCHCSCCGGIVLTAHTVELPLSPVEYLKAQYSDFLPRGIKEISLPVWQPPQLV